MANHSRAAKLLGDAEALRPLHNAHRAQAKCFGNGATRLASRNRSHHTLTQIKRIEPLQASFQSSLYPESYSDLGIPNRLSKNMIGL